jgi:hypothetical protein
MVNTIKVKVSRVTVYYPDWRAHVRPVVRCDRATVEAEGEDGGGPPSSPRPRGCGGRVVPMRRHREAA